LISLTTQVCNRAAPPATPPSHPVPPANTTTAPSPTAVSYQLCK